MHGAHGSPFASPLWAVRHTGTKLLKWLARPARVVCCSCTLDVLDALLPCTACRVRLQTPDLSLCHAPPSSTTRDGGTTYSAYMMGLGSTPEDLGGGCVVSTPLRAEPGRTACRRRKHDCPTLLHPTLVRHVSHCWQVETRIFPASASSPSRSPSNACSLQLVCRPTSPQKPLGISSRANIIDVDAARHRVSKKAVRLAHPASHHRRSHKSRGKTKTVDRSCHDCERDRCER